MSIIIQLILSGLAVGGGYCLIAYGFVLCWRVAKVLNLAQASSGVFGAFICFWLYGFGAPLFLSFICGVGMAAMLGLTTERLVINPLRQSKIAAWLIGGLGVDILLRETLTHWWGSAFYRFPSLLGGERIINIGDAATSNDRIFLIVCVFLIVYFLETISDHTMWGKKVRATAHDEAIAALMSINTKNVVIIIFSMTAALSAISVLLQASFTGLAPTVGFELTIKGFVVAIIGGLDSRRGAIIAAIIVGLLESIGGLIAPAGYRDVFTFGILVLVLIFKPQGVFGEVAQREV
jgi:branched-chain amino acid transport system permease protein